MSIILTVGGDFCPTGGINNGLSFCADSESFGLEDVRRTVSGTDLMIANLECPLTTSNKTIVKIGACFKAHPSTIGLLGELGVHLVTLANNHVRDFGVAGLIDTLNICATNGIDDVGAGLTLNEARRIYYRTIKGRTLAIINVAENEFASATPSRGGANPLYLISLLFDIREAKSIAEHVLLIIHGGLEYVHYPSPKSILLLRFLAEQGLTAIIRHHPHYVQGIEVWKGVPIFYSLGNFLYDSLNKGRAGWFEGILVTLSIDRADSCSYEVHPFEQCKNNSLIRMLEGAEKESSLERLDRYSKVILDPEKHEKKWHDILNERRQAYLGLLTLPSHFLFRLFRKLELLRYIKPSQRKRLLLENYLRCETHREALLDILTTS
jgi:poly-gamma-glutamate synthesis protein (capsule biosynthesis protein)